MLLGLRQWFALSAMCKLFPSAPHLVVERSRRKQVTQAKARTRSSVGPYLRFGI